MLNCFCLGCHTSDDAGGCGRCDIGRANDMMLAYLKEQSADEFKSFTHEKLSKEMKYLMRCVGNEEAEHRWIRLHSYFMPHKASKKYLDEQKEKRTDAWSKGLWGVWAAQREGSDRLMKALDEGVIHTPFKKRKK